MAGQKKSDRSSKSRTAKSTPSHRSRGANEGDESRREQGGREQDRERARFDREAEQRGRGREETRRM